MFFNRNVRNDGQKFTTNSEMGSDHKLFKSFKKAGYLSKLAPNMVILEKEGTADCKKFQATIAELKEENTKLLDEKTELLSDNEVLEVKNVELEADLKEAVEAIEELKKK